MWVDPVFREVAMRKTLQEFGGCEVEVRKAQKVLKSERCGAESQRSCDSVAQRCY